MPYIDKDERLEWSRFIGPLVDAICQDVRHIGIGEINYLVTRIVHAYLHEKNAYHAYNEVIGVLECAKLELYRRRVAEYEEKKRAANGDI